MKIYPVLVQPKEGDTLLIQGFFGHGEPNIQLLIVKQVKVTEKDGTEIILKKRGNCYFNWQMFSTNKSWVTEAYFVER